jgi:gluconokinase
MSPPILLVLTGGSGAGKSTVGRALADRLGWLFVEGDDFHPFANIEKMSRGVPLVDADREPWLDALGVELALLSRHGRAAVASCSALKSAYRVRLEHAAEGIRFVHLHCGAQCLAKRLSARHGHFAGEDLLESQLATLEPPDPRQSLIVDAERSVTEIVQEICLRMDLRQR